LFPDHIEPFELSERGFTVCFQFYISSLSQDFSFSISCASSNYRISPTWGIILTLPEISRMLSLPFRLSTVPASSAPIGHARLLASVAANERGSWQLSILFAQSKNIVFVKPAALPTVSEIPCLKSGNYWRGALREKFGGSRPASIAKRDIYRVSGQSLLKKKLL